jgi:hypothetical protein
MIRPRIAAIALTGIALTVAPAKAATELPATPNDPIVCQTSWADNPHTAISQCWGIGTWRQVVQCSSGLTHTGTPITQTTYASTTYTCPNPNASVTDAYVDILD